MPRKICVYTLIIFFSFIFIGSCNVNNNYTPRESADYLHYDVIHIDKEKKKKYYKLSYGIVLNNKKNLKLLRNDGKLISYLISKNEILLDEVDYIFDGLVDLPKEKLSYENKNVVLKFPLRKEENWFTNDLTTLIMKMGYDRIFQTLLPIEIENKIVNTKENIKINTVLIKNTMSKITKSNAICRCLIHRFNQLLENCFRYSTIIKRVYFQ